MDDIKNSRFEFKYRIPYQQYLKAKNALEIYMKKDKFTLRSQGKGYLVRSLYYDTNEYASYHEKMAGDNQRVKLRIRSYSEVGIDDTPIRAELKMRRRNLVIKKSSFVTYKDYLNFRENEHWGIEDNPTLIEFERYMLSYLHQPKVLIQYNREGYKSRDGNDLRITFDHKVKSGHSNSLFPDKIFLREHYPHVVIMEIKFKEGLPIWVKKLTQSLGLRIVANSKFTQAIQVSRNDLYHPGGIVVVR